MSALSWVYRVEGEVKGGKRNRKEWKLRDENGEEKRQAD